MWVVIFWVVFAVLVGVMAAGKGRNGFLGFLLAAVLSPLIGFIIVLCLRDKKREAVEAQRHAEVIAAARPEAVGDTRECPRCAETIKRAAKVCRFCNAELAA